MTYEELKQELQDCSKDEVIYHLYMKSMQLETVRKERNRLEIENQALRIALKIFGNRVK